MERNESRRLRKVLTLMAAILFLASVAHADRVTQRMIRAELNRLTSKDIPALQARASAGDAYAQTLLAMAYMDDLFAGGKKFGLKQKGDPVTTWLGKAASQGFTPAQYVMGWVCEIAKPPRFECAVNWYRLAAEHGDPDAQEALGRMYWNGHGVGQDKVEACRWRLRSAQAGNGMGQFTTAGNYLREPTAPNCVKPDRLEAGMWFSLSLESMSNESGDFYDQVRSVAKSVEFSFEERKEIDRRVAEWKANFEKSQGETGGTASKATPSAAAPAKP
jgi:TPR repeat protein